ncbi:MAG TPA: hypothetical protein VGW34_08120 [Allosphingosinicella sp.]|nr:hypothetical protein [Allosphingosinicella sp.]
MSNLSTIGGAALWAAVVSTLMLAALTPVSVTTPASAPPSVAQGSSLTTFT